MTDLDMSWMEAEEPAMEPEVVLNLPASPKKFDITPIALDLVPYERIVAKMVKEAMAIKVTDPESQKAAVIAISRIVAVDKDLVNARKQFTIPINNQLKEIRRLFSTLEDPLGQGTKHLKDELGRYESAMAMERRRKEAQIREEQRRLQEQLDAEARAQRKEAERKAKEAAEQLKTEEDETARTRLQQTIEEETLAASQSVAPVISPVVAEKPKMVRTNEGATYTKMKWECRIVNPDEVPRDCCEPSQKLLDARVKAGAREIPGCIIEEVPIIHVRV